VWILIKTCVQNFAAEGTGIDAFIIYDSDHAHSIETGTPVPVPVQPVQNMGFQIGCITLADATCHWHYCVTQDEP
jgi:hypothetical protein